MPNVTNKAIQQRLNDTALELTQDELALILETELAKPEQEMDAQLVDEGLAALQPDELSPLEQQAVWNRLKPQMYERRKLNAVQILQRAGLIAAAVIVLFLGMMGAASAFRWTFLLKLLTPVAETFGILMNVSDEVTPSPVPGLYTVEETGEEQVDFTDLSAIPDWADGYAVKPGWIPERYVFRTGSHFAGFGFEMFTLDYESEAGEFLAVTLMLFNDEESVSSYVYEKTVDEPVEKRIGSQLVTFCRNAKDEVQLVSWVDGNAHYSISGQVAEDEIIRMVESLSKPAE